MGSRPSSFTLSRPGPLRLFSTAELLTLPPPEWLVDTIIPEGGLVGLYGPPESTKSFLAIDLALCVATGRAWHGHPVQKGFVLYVASEGGPGISKRVRAWLQHYGLPAAKADVAWLVESLTIHKESDDVDVLMARLDTEVDRAPALIIVDTLARCLEGNENEQEDMGRFVAGLDRFRHEYGAALLVIHHARLDGERERGSTAFRAGVDTMIAVTREGQDSPIEVTCSKQKDAEHFTPMTFLLEVVLETGSCVVVKADAVAAARKTHAPLLTALGAGPLTWDDWRSSTNLPKSTFYRGFMELKKNGLIIKENGQWRGLGPGEFHDPKWHK